MGISILLITGREGQIIRSVDLRRQRHCHLDCKFGPKFLGSLSRMITFRENYGQIFSSTGSSVSSEHAPTGSWPNVAAQAFAMDSTTNSGSHLWEYKTESPPVWKHSEKSESPLWETSKDLWDVDLSHQLAAKLLLLDEPPASQLIDQQMLGQHSSSFTYGQDLALANSTFNPRFKTEICRNFKEKGTCLYGDLCQFAHGKHELRKDVVRHNKYKTKLCQKYWIAGYCAYGPRCNFIHQEKEGLAAIPFHELPASVRACYPAQPALFKTAADVIGMASNINIRKSSLGDSGDSGSDEVTVGTVKPRGLQVPVFYPREKTMSGGISSNRFGYANDFTSYGNQWGSSAPIGSGRPGPRVVWPGA